ncbi:MAG: 8-amino-7-oxononanoate synthase [Thermoguttaceae bacterium]
MFVNSGSWERGVKSNLSWIDDELEALGRKSLRRRLRIRTTPQSARLAIDGRELMNFGSNDYLGLAADPRLAAAVGEAIQCDGWGSGASPLVTGHASLHDHLQRRLAEFEGTEAALLFSSGFAANSGTIAALAGPGDVVYCDRKNHASLWDGCRLSRADVRSYPHNDCGQLARLLDKSSKYRRRLIVTDSLFSMDGDLAPLGELADLADRYEAMLMVDEAHATGVFGRNGRGVAEHLGVDRRIPVRIGTLSKALGSIGGFVAGSRSLVEWLMNRARPYVFSTAAPAAMAAAAIAALDIVRDEPQRRQALLARSAALRTELAARGWNVGASVSQIIPIIVGEPERAVALSQQLHDRGFFVPAIRPPTVPDGEACLRLSLTAGHTEEMVSSLLVALASIDRHEPVSGRQRIA